ncbi:hypothetical protein [Flavobacterium sp.]|uniref:hypothetical protein n=1 Tax=Flavobacterium sp. TaxID=239 RepID=UPI003D0D93F8
MENDKIKFQIIFIILSIFTNSCSSNYVGHYYSKNNSSLNKSEIEIDSEYLIYKASSDMLGTVIQKEKYLIDKDSLIVKFKTDSLVNPFVVSHFDSQIKGIKINLVSILTNDSIAPVANVTINDSIKYISKSNDTILNIARLKKIEFNDVGLNFIRDTIINFSNNNDNVFKIRLESRNELPVLEKSGTYKYLIKGRKLYILTYDKLINKYIKTERYYIKR